MKQTIAGNSDQEGDFLNSCYTDYTGHFVLLEQMLHTYQVKIWMEKYFPQGSDIDGNEVHKYLLEVGTPVVEMAEM